MNYKIYIQALNNFPIADWAVSAYMGFKSTQTDIYFFEDIEEVPVSPLVILVASIENSNTYLGKMGIAPKKALNLPEELRSYDYLRRGFRELTMGEFKKDWVEGKQKDVYPYPLFIKPNGRAKEFVAGVVSDPKNVPIFFHDIDDKCPILLTDAIDIVSEYRGYVIDGQLKGIKHYLGDIRIFPNMEIVDEMIKKYKSAPIGYSIDVGITSDGHTVLIECNDGFSLGNYGLDHGVYSRLLAKRWMQIISSGK